MNKITAICCTYRRPELLEEAIQSFLMQDYAGEKELIIINDEPTQELIFKHSQVKIYNYHERAPTLAMKHNHAVSLATGSIIIPWDDDDIYLPHRLSAINAQHKDGLWYTDHLFIDREDGGIDFSNGPIHCNTGYTKDAFIKCGAYHDEPQMAFDCVIVNGIRDIVKKIGEDNIKPSYIYRKNSGTRNFSKLFNGDVQRAYEEYPADHAEFTDGKIVLNPHWTKDWSGMAEEALLRPPVPLHELDESSRKPVVVNI